MPLNQNQQEVPELFQFLLDQFCEAELGEAGQEPEPSALDALFASLPDYASKEAASAGINAFLAFARQFMLDHPPQTHIMLSEGFGVMLAGGYNVALTPQTEATEPGGMQEAGDIPVTQGRTMRGQSGIVPSQGVDITGPTQP
jgi:hypothetical protein